MDNKIKFQTRLAAIQLVSQQLVNEQNIDIMKNDFDNFYRNTIIDDSLEKVKYNKNFLSELINKFKKTDIDDLTNKINKIIKFDRKFEKWDSIIKGIILIAISELQKSKKSKKIIILNDYIEISKSFVNLKETKLINSILDKLIHEE